jgi:hypothetical protein
MYKMKDAYKTLFGIPEGKRSVGRNRCRGGDNIKMHLKELVCESVKWIQLAQDRIHWQTLVNTLSIRGR